MDMNIQKYAAFVKMVELGSFTKAAEALNYSQSGISRMIQDLETEWGLTLLERNRAGLRLTADGIIIFPLVKRITEEYQTLQRKLDELRGIESGIIRIGTFSSVATNWLPRMIKAFQSDYPDIQFELLLGDYLEIEKWIVEGRVDFGFLRLPTLPDLETTFLEQDELMIVLPENHPAANKGKFPVADLQGVPFILLEKEGSSDVTELFRTWGVFPSIHYKTWDDYAIMSMVENGLGISMLPKLILQRVPYRIITKELDVPAFRKIGIAYKKRETLSLASKEFLKYINNEL